MSPDTTTLRKLLWTVFLAILLFGTRAEFSSVNATLPYEKTAIASIRSATAQSFDMRRSEPASLRLATSPSSDLASFLLSGDWLTNSGSLGTGAIFARSAALVREVRIVSGPLTQGQPAAIAIEMDASGNENAIGFSLNFDASKLTYVSSVRGADSTGTTLNINTLQLATGRLGLAIAFPSEVTFAAGTRQVVVVNFNVAASATGPVNLSFGDVPVAREVADATANVLDATYTNAAIPVNSPLPSLAGSTPASTLAGSGDFAILVEGANFVNGSVVRFNGSDLVTTFENVNQLTAVIPASALATAGSATITVFTAPPGGGLSNAIGFSINNPAPVLASLSPALMLVGNGGATLTINGTGFINGSIVQVGGSPRATTFVNATQLTAQLEAEDLASAGLRNITVQNEGPGGGTSNALNLTVNNPVPSIGDVSPSAVTAGTNAFTLTVNGSNFVTSSVVKLNGSNRPTNFVNSSQLTADIPAADIASAGSLSISVESPAPGGGASNAVDLAVNNPAPVMGGISPATITVGGTSFTLTVNGSGFIDGSVVQIGNSGRDTSFINSTQLTATITVADIQSTGSFAITVFNLGPGGGTSAPINLSVENPSPALTSISPSSKTVGDADFILSVSGSNFVDGAEVRLNGAARSTTFVSSTSLTAQVTAADLATAGILEVTVVNPTPGGGTSNALNLGVNNPLPAMSSISPESMIAGSGGGTVTINGSGFVNGSEVRVGGSPRATNFVSSSQLTAEILAADVASAGTLTIGVHTAEPGGGTSNTVNLTVNNPLPSIAGLTPAGVTAGTDAFILTVDGSNFVATSVVKVNGSDRPTSFINNSQLAANISATDIASAGSLSITVDSPAPGGGSSNAVELTVNNPVPVISEISPAAVTVAGGDFLLTVNGSGFINGSMVRVNGSDRSTSFISPTQLTAQILAADIATAGSQPITVFNAAPGGGSAAALNLAVNNPAPIITSLSPAELPVGSDGFALTVAGSNFVSGAVVQVNGSDRSTTFVNGNQLTAEIPASDLTAVGSLPVTVTNPAPGGGTSSALNLNIGKANQTIAFAALANKGFGDPDFDLSASSSSSLPVSFAAAGNCSVTGATVHLNGAGSCTITASQAGNDTYNAAPDVLQSFNIGKASQTITLAPLADRSFGDPDFDLSASASSGLPISYAAAGNCTVTGASVHLTGAGSCTITASQAGDDNYNAASDALQSFNIGKGGQEISFAPLPDRNLNDPDFDVSASASSGLAVSFAATGNCTVTGATVHLTAAGSCTITASQAGDENYNAASDVAQSFTVHNPAPSISALSPNSAGVGTAGFTLTITGSNILSGAVVRVNGTDRSTSFVDGTQLTAEIPASDLATAGILVITVTNPGASGGTSNALNLTVNNPVPAVSDLSPENVEAGGTAFMLTVNGSNFVSSSVVKFNGGNCPTTFVSSTQLTAAFSAADIGQAGTYPVSVDNPAPGGGASNSMMLTVNNPAPAVAGISPATVLVGGGSFNLNVNGSGFVEGSVVHIGGSARNTSFVSGTQLMAEITAADIQSTGSFAVTVHNGAPGGGTSAAMNLSVENPGPSVTLLSPAAKLVGEGDFVLTITGTNFVDGAMVKLNGNDRPTTFVDNTGLTAQVSASDLQTAGVLVITVVNPAPGGGESNGMNLEVNNPAPAMTNLSPDAVAVGSNTFTLTINGSGFNGDSTVMVDGNGRTTTFVSSSQLSVEISAAEVANAAILSIAVQTAAPGGGTSNALNLTVNNPVPSMGTISPDTVMTGSGAVTLTINGSNFVNGSVVKLNGSSRPTTFVNSGQLMAELTAADTAGAGSLAVTVMNTAPGGGTSNTLHLAVDNPEPSLTGLSPASASAGGPSFTLNVLGSNFVGGAMVSVNGNSRPTAFVNSSHLTVQISSLDILSVGTLSILVANPGPGGGMSSAMNLTVTLPTNDARAIRVLDVTAAAGENVTVLVEMVAKGDENSWGFSLQYDPNVMTFVSAGNGIDVPSGSLLVNSTEAAGHVGIAGALPAGAVLSAGVRQILTLEFAVPANGTATATDLKFVDFPIAREVVNVNAAPLSTAYAPGVVTIAYGFEADVAPRPNGTGDGTVTIQDWNQVGRFMALLDQVSMGSEFQRADCSPRETRGDGRLSVADWTQAGRYAAILDPVAFAGGPSAPVASAGASAARLITSEAIAAKSVVRMDALGINSGSISITLDAQGSENAVGFSLTFDANKVKFLGAEKGIHAAQAIMQINLTSVKKGRVGFAIALPSNEGFPAGKFELMRIRFAPLEEGLDASAVNFADLPIDREVADLNATPVKAAFVVEGAATKNPIDEAEFFVRQQYLDFLGRTPDLGGLEYWTSQIADCGADANCAQQRRIGVSAAFFIDQEFQQTGFFVHRMFKVLLGRQPLYAEFNAERGNLNAGARLERDKSTLIQAWLGRQEILARYPTTMDAEAFVDSLLQTINRGSGVDLSAERHRLVALATEQGRASVVRNLVDNATLSEAEYNAAFVLAEYFGYLRRDPDPKGFEFWLNTLNNRVPNNYRAMVCAFITSPEYQRRFGTAISRSNSECGP